MKLLTLILLLAPLAIAPMASAQDYTLGFTELTLIEPTAEEREALNIGSDDFNYRETEGAYALCADNLDLCMVFQEIVEDEETEDETN